MLMDPLVSALNGSQTLISQVNNYLVHQGLGLVSITISFIIKDIKILLFLQIVKVLNAYIIWLCLQKCLQVVSILMFSLLLAVMACNQVH